MARLLDTLRYKSVTSSITDRDTNIFIDLIPKALELTQSLTEMSTRDISWGGG